MFSCGGISIVLNKPYKKQIFFIARNPVTAYNKLI